jgi:hypothetical protein
LDAFGRRRPGLGVRDRSWFVGFAGRALTRPNLVLGVIYNPSSTIQIADVPIIFPRIPSRSRSDREEIINLVLRDLLDAAGEQSDWPRLVLTD